VVSDFLSPRVARLHSVDPSVLDYFVETLDPHHQFKSFRFLGSGSVPIANEGRSGFLLSVSRELGNSELYFAILDHVQGELTLSKALNQVTGFPDFASERFISFLASHFSELGATALAELPISALFRVVSHHSLTVTSEDAALDFVSSQVSVNPEYFNLLRLMRLEFLSVGSLSRFVSMTCDHFAMVDPHLCGITGIGDRLILPRYSSTRPVI
jgi:hypothetical protein